MDQKLVIQGRAIRPEDVALIRDWLQAHPDSNRTRLSRELCRVWNWRNGAGRLKDMACRTLLLKLEARGQIRLPPRRTASVNGLRNRQAPGIPHDQTPIEGPLELLATRADRTGGRRHVPRLGSSSSCCSVIIIWACATAWARTSSTWRATGTDARWRACCSARRPGRPRRGTSGSAGMPNNAQRHLGLLTNNTRFLVLPWVRVPHLASHLLGRVAARLSADWQQKYGHPIDLLETFVEQPRFAGTCYRAAGWVQVGLTTGRTRNDDGRKPGVPAKPST